MHISLYFTPTWGTHGLSDVDEIWHTYRAWQRNQFCKIWWRSVQGFLRGGGAKIGVFPLPDYLSLPLCFALPCMQVIRKQCTFSLYFTPTWGAHGLTDPNQIWHTYRSRQRNQFCKISSRSGQGFLCGEGVKMGLSPLPANTPLPLCIALPCMQVM